MMTYNVNLLVGFDNVKFGMNRLEVRKLLGEPVREFKKSKFSKVTTDDYSEYHIFYDKDNKFEAVEFFEGAEIKVDDKIIFPISLNILKEMHYNLISDGDGFISTKFSIGVYAPNKNPESILFAKRDYYL